MAQRVEVQYVDDIDGSEAEGTIRFGIDGREFEIDLSKKNAARIAKALQPYIAASRKVSTGSRRRGGSSPTPKSKHDQAAVRAWGTQQGYKVSSRGRISAEITAAYAAAH